MKKKYKIFSPNGIDEKSYVNINGQNQYVFIRGKDITNPIILNLHGGPANPDAFFTYEFAKGIIDDYTYVSWDQRGCGRTYYRNKRIDIENTTADFEQAIKDVDELVKYLCNRFKKEKIIIMGHSYGSLLGVAYVSRYSERVEGYLGIGQSVSIKDTQASNYGEVLGLLKDDYKKSKKITDAYQRLKDNFNMENLMKFQQLAIPNLAINMTDLKKKNQVKLILQSPDLSFNDIKWLLGMLNWKRHYKRNRKLLDYTLSANIFDIGVKFSVPMYFISGEYDRSCRVELLQVYYDEIIAPRKELVIVKKCSHSPQIDAPMLFAGRVKKLLEK